MDATEYAMPGPIERLLTQLSSLLVGWLPTVQPARVFIAGAILTVVILFRKPLGTLALNILGRFAAAVGLCLGGKVRENLKSTSRVYVVASGSLLALRIAQLPAEVTVILQKVLLSALVAAFFAALYTLAEEIPARINAQRLRDPNAQTTWLVVVAKFVVVCLAIAMVLQVWDIDVGPALTGVGLAGAAAALAAQDLLKNLLAGFNNANERRFREGDWIRVDGQLEGIVESINLRSTMIRRFDMAPIHVPNSELANQPLINFNRRPYRRIRWHVSLKRETTNDQLRQIRDRTERFIDESELFVPHERANRLVRIESFGESSVEMLVLCFTVSNTYDGYTQAEEELLLAIRSIVEEIGAAFAYPSRNIYTDPVSGEPAL